MITGPIEAFHTALNPRVDQEHRLNSPEAVAKALHRVRYDVHLKLFTQLCDSPFPCQLQALTVSETFKRIWTLCLRNADPDELDSHTTTVGGMSVEELISVFLAWSPEEQASFARCLQQTLEHEAHADEKRGRHRLAGMLHSAATSLESLANTLEAIA